MNEIAMMDKNLSIGRTPELIAVEINSIKEQTRKFVLFNSIEIGRRLTEAKLMIEHGQWSEWLEKSVDYSQRTANNLMRIFTDYGSSQMVMFCDNAKSQALANLSYTQAVALLGIPMDERELFIQEHDIDSMSTRELKQAIKEKQELEAKIKELEVGWSGTKKVADKAKQEAKEKEEEVKRLLEEKQQAEADKHATEDRLKKLLEEAQASGDNDEVDRLKGSLEKTNSDLAMSLSKIEELERQLKEEPIEVTAAAVVEKIPDEIEKELNELRERNKELEAKGVQPISTATIRFKLHFDSLVKGFGDLLGVLDEIDAEVREKYKGAVVGLIGKMSEKL